MKQGSVPVTTRLAPSPSGRMHLGNLWSSLLGWLAGRSAGGRVLLRLEDLDPDRCRREYCDQVMRDFEWLGLDWDNAPVYQSARTPLYEAAFHRLDEQGLVYPCYCTRAERLAASAPHQGDGVEVYDGRCRHLSASQRLAFAAERRPSWRISVPEGSVAFSDLLQGEYRQVLRRDCGDFILRRSDGVYAYQLAVVVDDGEMGVTRVVRGSDLLSSTPRQIWLGQRLGLPAMEYAHVPLLLAGDGRRLAKRDRDQGLDDLQKHYSAPQLVGWLAHLAGLIPEQRPITPRELIPLFSWERVAKRDIML